jgi:nucleotide-binding universal stress UspA family protein
MPWTLSARDRQIVLLPFDFSDAASEALATARELITRPEQLVVLHVIVPLETNSPAFIVGELDVDELRAHADTELAKVLSNAGIGEAARRVVVGDPADEILAVAQEIDAAVIVMPSRGKVGLRRWMVGSVAERVVRRARCPVLVLPILAESESET